MDVEKSKAVPKALWLALILIGMITAYSDFRHQRPVREGAERGLSRMRDARLSATEAFNDDALDRSGATSRR